MFLVDANVVSELSRSQPNARVISWMRQHERELAVNPIILGEIRYGIYLLPAGARRRRLEHWYVQVVEKIQCIPIDGAIGVRWARLIADLRAKGEAIPVKDSLIAATALARNWTVATHNTKDFAKSGVKLFDPYLAP